MADILSQDELDALLSQMKDSDEDKESPRDGDSVSNASEKGQELQISQGNLNVDMILNLPVKVCAELGRARVSVAEILGFCQGSVVELDNVAGDAINLTMNDRVVAVGEAVVVNENFGLRISEVDSVRERITKL
ncbi:MAG: FliM/FliN family flagellar motor switch protein [Bradymonadia bacterium]